ncbi:uroporphyrinogen-III synthase [Caulobacter segnis]
MEEGAPVWITRARPGALATAERVAALGFEAIVDPLLAVAFLDAEPPTSPTSQPWPSPAPTASRPSRGWSDERGLPVFAVGRATAKAAQDAGFVSVSSADGDVEDLCDLIAAGAPGPVLWAGAREPAGDLVGRLRGRGGDG